MSSTLIIAEAGVNHNGDLEIAKKLIEVASDAGADYVKFQTFEASKLVTNHAQKAAYQVTEGDTDHTQYHMLQKLELDYNAHLELISHCNRCGIKFLSTGFDIDSVAMLDRLGVELLKVPSGEITNLLYLEYIARLGRPVILSTGMATLGEVEDALKVLESNGCYDVTVLHCTTAYPTAMDDVNLQAMLTIRNAFGVKVGYSDHTLGVEVAIAAVAMGATVIEKHFTLDRTLVGPDHRASLEPEEVKAMVKSIRNIELALGNGRKSPTYGELENRMAARKSIVAAKNISKGMIYSLDNLEFKRPGTGLSPMVVKTILGKPALRDYLAGELIES